MKVKIRAISTEDAYFSTVGLIGSTIEVYSKEISREGFPWMSVTGRAELFERTATFYAIQYIKIRNI